MWNCRELQAPPICSMPLEEDNFPDLKSSKRAFKEVAVQHDDILSSIKVEMFVLRRVLYKGNNQFRYDKFHKRLQQLQVTLKRIVDINPLEIIAQFTDALESRGLKGDKVYIPCQQYGVYCLTRVVGLAALFAKAGAYCFEIYQQNLGQLRLGFFVPGILFNSTFISRIWILCRTALESFNEWYGGMLEFVSSSPPSLADTGYAINQLPAQLNDFLIGIDNQNSIVLGSLESGAEISDNSQLAVNHRLSTSASKSGLDTSNQLDASADIGKVISREDYAGKQHSAPCALENDGLLVTVPQHSKKGKLFNEKTSKVMDKVHNFLADEVGEPYSERQRRKSTLEIDSEMQRSDIVVDCKKWEMKIHQCKSIDMVRKVLNKLRVSVEPHYNVRGLLKAIKKINILSSKSKTCDVAGAKQVAKILIQKLKTSGLSKSVTPSNESVKDDSKSSDDQDFKRIKMSVKKIKKKTKEKDNSAQIDIQPEHGDNIVIRDKGDVTLHMTKLLMDKGFNYTMEALGKSHHSFFVGKDKITLDVKSRRRITKLFRYDETNDTNTKKKPKKKITKMIVQILHDAVKKHK